jgi:hypothetical protein
MMYNQETYEPTVKSPILIRALTSEEAYQQAREWMCSQSPIWCDATDSQIRYHLCYTEEGCTIFVGEDPVRLAICGSSECPVSEPAPPVPGGSNTLLIALGGLAVVGVVAVAIASQGKKKKVVVRRLGQPRTEEERRERHIERYGTSELPPRGTGLRGG